MKFREILFTPWGRIFIVLTIVVPSLNAMVLHSTQDDIVFTIEKAERVTNVDGAKYLIFTKTEVFENTDQLFFWKFNSSDIYGSLKAGKSYEARVVGLRVPFFSWYRNIISVQEK